MKFLIASDIHGSSLYCRQLLSRYQHEKADKLLLLVASSVVLLLIAIFVIYVNARILEQVAVGFIPSAPNFSNFGF